MYTKKNQPQMSLTECQVNGINANVSLKNSDCANDNDIAISSIQSTAITSGETPGVNTRDCEMKHDGIR